MREIHTQNIAHFWIRIYLRGVSNTFNDYQEVKVLKGNVIEVLPTLDIAKVAFAHIDMNAPEPELVRTRALSPADDERRMHYI